MDRNPKVAEKRISQGAEGNSENDEVLVAKSFLASYEHPVCIVAEDRDILDIYSEVRSNLRKIRDYGVPYLPDRKIRVMRVFSNLEFTLN
jgi:hypothetical protein